MIFSPLFLHEMIVKGSSLFLIFFQGNYQRIWNFRGTQGVRNSTCEEPLNCLDLKIYQNLKWFLFWTFEYIYKYCYLTELSEQIPDDSLNFTNCTMWLWFGLTTNQFFWSVVHKHCSRESLDNHNFHFSRG